MTTRKANANPTKSFFVRMLTRDITLDDCILDLVDNSIDSAWEQTGSPPSTLANTSQLNAFTVSIQITDDSFTISDNCGGISLHDAENYAFTFGRRESDAVEDYSVGVYGIGMKRAIFKIGNNIEVQSTHRTASVDIDSFRVPILVNQWLAESDDAPWDFAIEDADNLEEPGVRITIRDLTEDAAARFQTPTYIGSLRRTLEQDYMLALMHGLTLELNGIAIKPRQIALLQGADFAPMRDGYEDAGVSVEIVAGMSSSPPDEADPDESERPDRTSGWYVFCNGRAILTADTSALTGFGSVLPRWHNQYSGFIGMIFFRAINAADLPMTTTKRSIDTSSSIWRRAIPRMAIPGRAWIDYTNARKGDREAAKQRELQTKPLDLADIPQRKAVVLPKSESTRPRAKVANINYTRPLQQVRLLGEALGDINLTYRDVGILSFEYAYDRLIDEDGE